jgi:hypothetical protein
VLWLETAPPARREIVLVSPFPIGSIAPADIAAIPAGVGVRLDRAGVLPQSRTVPDGRLLTSTGVREREVTLDGERTSVRETGAGAPLAWPIDVEAPKAEQPVVDAAVAAVLSQRVWAAPPGHRARLVLAGAAQGSGVAQGTGLVQDSRVAQRSDVAQPPPQGFGEPRRSSPAQPASEGGGFSPAIASASSIDQPWMSTAIARIAADPDFQAAGAHVATGFDDTRFRSAPWQPLVSAGDGRPLAAAAGSGDRLLVASAAPASDIATPVLLRAIANGIATAPDLHAAEVVPISDQTLRLWSRPAGPPEAPRVGTIEQDDRRWLWLAALILMGVETWMRRARAHESAASGFSRTDDPREKDARVA